MDARAGSLWASIVTIGISWTTLISCSRGEALTQTRFAARVPTTSSREATPAPRGVESPGIERSFVMVQQRRLSLHLPSTRAAPLPTVLVFHSAMGRTESVLESCDRLAAHGFAALALDFYDGRVATSPNEAIALRDSANSRVPVLRGIVDEAYRQLESDPRLRSKTRFLLGWSFGAAWATVAAGFLPDVKGVVAYYGEAFSDNSNLDEKLTAPVLFVGAERDSEPTPDGLRAIVDRLEAKGHVAQLLLIPAAHGFAERNHPGYDPRATELAWTSAIRFLDDKARNVPR